MTRQRPTRDQTPASQWLRISCVRVVSLPQVEVLRRQRELARALLQLEEAYRLGKARRHDTAA